MRGGRPRAAAASRTFVLLSPVYVIGGSLGPPASSGRWREGPGVAQRAQSPTGGREGGWEQRRALPTPASLPGASLGVGTSSRFPKLELNIQKVTWLSRPGRQF